MNKPILYCILAICFFAACKKDVKVNPVTPVKTAEVLFPSDSISYTVDGKTYILNNAAGVTTGNTEADRKDSVADLNHYYISGSKDSVFFYRTFNFSGPGSGLGISFFRKYAVKDMVSGVINYPTSQDDLFKPGNYPYGTDFNRENATNGVALAINGIGQTYSDQTLGIPVPITSASESNAHFQVLSFKLVSDQYPGQYVLEAKFDATLFDNSGATKQLSNGYIRMIVAVGND